MEVAQRNAIVWLDGPAEGAWNMAMDDAMVQLAAEENCIILRLYQWSRPTLSLGYFQKFDERDSISNLADIDCVRRVTGGGAIVHDQELTYSLAIPKSFEDLHTVHPYATPLTSGAGNRSNTVSRLRHAEWLYRAVHSRVKDWLVDLGFEANIYEALRTSPDEKAETGISMDSKKEDTTAFLCFDRRSEIDIVVGTLESEQKVLGSAQRRTSGTLLQHGSLLLAPSLSVPHLLGLTQPVGVGPKLPLASAQVPEQLIMKKWEWAIDFCGILQDSIDSIWDCDWSYREPEERVLDRAREICETRYNNESWFLRHVKTSDSLA